MRQPWPSSKPTKAPRPVRRHSSTNPIPSQSAACVARTAAVRSFVCGIFYHPEKSLHEWSNLLICGDGPASKRPVQFGSERFTHGLCPRCLPKPAKSLGYRPTALREATTAAGSGCPTETENPTNTRPVPIKLQEGDRGSDLVQRGFCCGESRLYCIRTRSARRNKNLNTFSLLKAT